MKIGIDCRFAGTPTGLGHYAKELVSAMLQRNDGHEYSLFVRSADEPWLKPFANNANIIQVPARHYSLAEQIQLLLTIRRAGIDLFFALHFNVPLWCPVPFVVTIHDLILHRYPGDVSFLKRIAYRFLVNHAVKKSAGIIAVSEYTKKEIGEMYAQHVLSKTKMIYEGVSSDFKRQPLSVQAEVRLTYSLPERFFLYVGSSKVHKQVPLLIEAFQASSTHGRSLVLVTNGPQISSWSSIPGVHVLSHVPDHDLPALYASADAFVTASIYEGFGLPIVEAEACGCPVIAFHVTSIPEVASASAFLIEPTKDALISALSQQSYAPPSATGFTWQLAAKETADFLRKVLE
jgi:glycosyltransferase involved in cell wall biosynthesis